MLTQGASSPMTARAKNRKSENSGGNELANRAVPDVQPGSVPALRASCRFRGERPHVELDAKRATASTVLVLLEMLSCLGRRA